jgi:hypothetical protein
MTRLALPVLLLLAACSSAESAGTTETVAPDANGWRLASGKEPTKAEFAALAATCEAKGSAVDDCLTELGLKRAQ